MNTSARVVSALKCLSYAADTMITLHQELLTQCLSGNKEPGKISVLLSQALNLRKEALENFEKVPERVIDYVFSPSPDKLKDLDDEAIMEVESYHSTVTATKIMCKDLMGKIPEIHRGYVKELLSNVEFPV